jgi:uncharacterized protein (TIGR00725 family)
VTMTSRHPDYVAVLGPGDASAEEESLAAEVGRLLGERGAVVVCGGLGGVMEAVCRGAREAGGTSVGILSGADRSAANGYVDVALATGMGEMRNALVAGCADVLIAVGGEFGTLSEIALGLKAGKRVIGIGTWDIDGVEAVDGPEQAVRAALGA